MGFQLDFTVLVERDLIILLISYTGFYFCSVHGVGLPFFFPQALVFLFIFPYKSVLKL